MSVRHFAAATETITQQHGLTTRRYDLLAILHAEPGRACTATRLGDLLEISVNGVTELVTRAQVAGLVDRTVDAHDTRVKHIRPTAEGTRRYFRTVAALRPERDRLLRILDEMRSSAARLAPDTRRP
jgi:DNA-binding MarR family transcriptional regulator